MSSYDKKSSFWRYVAGSEVPVYFVGEVSFKDKIDPLIPENGCIADNAHMFYGPFRKDGRGLIADVSPVLGTGSVLQFRWDNDNKLDTTLLMTDPNNPKRNKEFKDFDDHHKDLDPTKEFNLTELDFQGNKIRFGIGSGISMKETLNKFYEDLI